MQFESRSLRKLEARLRFDETAKCRKRSDLDLRLRRAPKAAKTERDGQTNLAGNSLESLKLALLRPGRHFMATGPRRSDFPARLSYCTRLIAVCVT